MKNIKQKIRIYYSVDVSFKLDNDYLIIYTQNRGTHFLGFLLFIDVQKISRTNSTNAVFIVLHNVLFRLVNFVS